MTVMKATLILRMKSHCDFNHGFKLSHVPGPRIVSKHGQGLRMNRRDDFAVLCCVALHEFHRQRLYVHRSFPQRR